MSSPAAVAPDSQAPALSEGARIVNTFIAPSKTFTDIKRNASWFVPFLLMMVMSIAFIFSASQKVGWKKIAENQMNSSSFAKAQLEKLPPDQYQKAMAAAVTQTKVISYIFPVFTLLLFVIVAGVMVFSMNFMAGAQIKFATALAVVVYAWLPTVIRALLSIASIYAGANTDSFTFQNPVGSNPGYFMQPGGALYALMSGLDVFSIWICILMAIGFSRVSKLKTGTTAGIVFAWYAIVVLFGVGIAAVFS